MPVMKTYTPVWSPNSALYTIGDIPIPRTPYISLIFGAMFAVIWLPITLLMLGLSFTNFTGIVVIALPILGVGWAVDKLTIESKTLPQLFRSRSGYIFEPKTLTDLGAPTEKIGKTTTAIYAKVWVPENPPEWVEGQNK